MGSLKSYADMAIGAAIGVMITIGGQKLFIDKSPLVSFSITEPIQIPCSNTVNYAYQIKVENSGSALADNVTVQIAAKTSDIFVKKRVETDEANVAQKESVSTISYPKLAPKSSFLVNFQSPDNIRGDSSIIVSSNIGPARLSNLSTNSSAAKGLVALTSIMNGILFVFIFYIPNYILGKRLQWIGERDIKKLLDALKTSKPWYFLTDSRWKKERDRILGNLEMALKGEKLDWFDDNIQLSFCWSILNTNKLDYVDDIWTAKITLSAKSGLINIFTDIAFRGDDNKKKKILQLQRPTSLMESEWIEMKNIIEGALLNRMILGYRTNELMAPRSYALLRDGRPQYISEANWEAFHALIEKLYFYEAFDRIAKSVNPAIELSRFELELLNQDSRKVLEDIVKKRSENEGKTGASPLEIGQGIRDNGIDPAGGAE